MIVRRSASKASIHALRGCERPFRVQVSAPQSGDKSIQRRASNKRLDTWFPSLCVFPRPQYHRVLVVADVAVLGFAFQRSARALGDVAKVAEQRALVPL